MLPTNWDTLDCQRDIYLTRCNPSKKKKETLCCRHVPQRAEKPERKSSPGYCKLLQSAVGWTHRSYCCSTTPMMRMALFYCLCCR